MIICSVIWIPCGSRVCFLFCVSETVASLVCGLVCLQNSDFVVRELAAVYSCFHRVLLRL